MRGEFSAVQSAKPFPFNCSFCKRSDDPSTCPQVLADIFNLPVPFGTTGEMQCYLPAPLWKGQPESRALTTR